MNESMPPTTQPPASEAVPGSQAQVLVQRQVQQPAVTHILLGVTVLVFLLQLATEAGFLREPFIELGRLIFGRADMDALLAQGWGSDLLILLGAKIRVLIVQGQWWRLFTPALLHASLLHIGFNMYALYAVGRSLEMQYGHGRFLLLYVLGAFGGNTLSFLLSPGFSVGASTAVFGLIAAEGAFIFQNRHMFGDRARPALQNVVVILVVNLVLGLSSSGIDNWGHLGGLLAGGAFAWFAGPVLAVEGLWPEYRLVDRRSDTQAWVVGVVIAAVTAGLVLWGIRLYS